MARFNVALPKPMGLVFEDNDAALGGIYVAELTAGGAGEASGAVAVADQLVAVNGRPALGLSFDVAMDLIVDAADLGSGVELQFSRDEDPVELHNPRVFFDVDIGSEPAGRVEMCLRADVVPETVRTRWGWRMQGLPPASAAAPHTPP